MPYQKLVQIQLVPGFIIMTLNVLMGSKIRVTFVWTSTNVRPELTIATLQRHNVSTYHQHSNVLV